MRWRWHAFTSVRGRSATGTIFRPISSRASIPQPGLPATRFDVADPFTVLAVAGDDIVGLVTTSIADEPAVLMALYVDPGHWREGVGQQLMADALTRFRISDRTTAELWVLDGNERADRFYRAHGWRPDGRRRRENVRGVDVDEVAYTIAVV